MIEFQNVSFKIDQKMIVNQLSFLVKENEKVVLNGESGSGKSTILNLIMGFLCPTKGTIYFNGLEVNSENIANIRKNIAFIPDSFFFTGSVQSLVEFPFSFKENRKNKPSYEKITGVFHRLNLDEKLFFQKFETLSAGQKQRVMIAIALLLEKKIILADEVTSSLDKKNATIVENIFLGSSGYTILSASHSKTWVKKNNKVILCKVYP